MISLSTEIRHLPADVKQELADRLNVQDVWKHVAVKIQHPLRSKQLLFTEQHIYRIANTRNPFLTLLDDWGSHGKVRPNVQDLINVLTKCGFLNIANYLVVDILQEEPIGGTTTEWTVSNEVLGVSLSSPSTSNSALGQMPGANHRALTPEPVRQAITNVNEGIFDRPVDTYSQELVFSRIQDDSFVSISRPSVPSSSYKTLYQMTNGFDDRDLSMGGRKLGSGGFGIVYLGINDSCKVAVKKIRDKTREESFWNEIKIMSKLEHKNILTLLTYSIDGDYWCIVFEYMENGSLQDMLARKEKDAIPWDKRVSIATGIAQGLAYIHILGYIHRDVKSANVLLSKDLVPKLGDFGIIHSGPDLTERSQVETLHIMGARVYMAPEAFLGIVSKKLDTYSFGVVILELLTGSKPYFEEQRETLASFIGRHCGTSDQIVHYLDSLSGSWDHDIAKELFELSLKCIEMKTEQRPTVGQIVPNLEELTRRTKRRAA